MKRLLIVFLLFVSFQSVGSAASGLDPEKYFFNETFGDMAEELQNARSAGKHGVFLFFQQADCPYCHFMEQNILNQPDVQAYFRKNFLNFNIDIEGDIEMTDFSGKSMSMKDFATKVTHVRATPALIFYDLNGKVMFRNDGMATSSQEFMWMADYVTQGIYKQNIPFRNYKEQRRKEDR